LLVFSIISQFAHDARSQKPKASYMRVFNFLFLSLFYSMFENTLYLFHIFFIILILYIFYERFAVYDLLLQQYCYVIFRCTAKSNYSGEDTAYCPYHTISQLSPPPCLRRSVPPEAGFRARINPFGISDAKSLEILHGFFPVFSIHQPVPSHYHYVLTL